MSGETAQWAGAYMGLLFLALLVVAVLWVLLPFAVFGVKDLIREANHNLREQNRLLGELVEQGKAAAKRPPG